MDLQRQRLARIRSIPKLAQEPEQPASELSSVSAETDVSARRTGQPLELPSVHQTDRKTNVASRPGLGKRKLLLIGALLALALGGGAFGDWWWTVGRFTVSTDDA